MRQGQLPATRFLTSSPWGHLKQADAWLEKALASTKASRHFSMEIRTWRGLQ